MGVVIVEGKGTVLGVNVGLPFVTNEAFVASFGMVSGVGLGIDVWHGVHVAQGEGMDFVVVCPHWPNGFNGLIFKRNVFNPCVNI